MAKAIELYGPRGEKLRRSSRNYGGAGNNQLIPSATQNNKRKFIPFLDKDFHRNVSDLGRRVLASIGLNIYFACPAVRGAIEEFCEIATRVFTPQYRGTSARFKNLIETALYEHDRVIDFAGFPFCMETWRMDVLRSIFLSGDLGTALIEDGGMPYIQVIPGHRIASDKCVVEGGPYDGARIEQGVILDNFNRVLAYRVLTGADADMQSFRDISAQSMFLSFRPMFPGQVRGVSLLGIAGWDFQDLSESRLFELLAQKQGAGRVFQEFNETGEAPIGSDHIVGPSSGSDTGSSPSGLWREVIDGGINTYFQANSGQRLEHVKFDRPSANQQAWVAQVTREAFAGTNLSVDFHLDPTKLAGANGRILIDKLNVMMAGWLRRIVEPAQRRIDAFRVPKLVGNGVLPSDWFNIEYQGPPKLTADRKYDADVAAIEIRTGVTTRAKRAGELGEDLVDVRDLRQREVTDKYRRAREIIAEFPEVSFQQALADLENDSMNGQVQAPPAEPKPEAAPEEEP